MTWRKKGRNVISPDMRHLFPMILTHMYQGSKASDIYYIKRRRIKVCAKDEIRDKELRRDERE